MGIMDSKTQKTLLVKCWAEWVVVDIKFLIQHICRVSPQISTLI